MECHDNVGAAFYLRRHRQILTKNKEVFVRGSDRADSDKMCTQKNRRKAKKSTHGKIKYKKFEGGK